jgi:hypothetical protein
MVLSIQRWTFILGVVTGSFTFANAQMKGWETGGWIGASNYFGDLNTTFRFNRIHLAGGLAARYNFNDRLAIRFSGNYGRISASDADSKNIYEQRRNLSFNSILADATAQFEFNFMPYIHGHRDYFFTPYMFVGPSAFYFNPTTEYQGQTIQLAGLGTEGQFKGEEYNTFQGALAFGMGFRYDLSYRWSLNIEFSARKLFTDYIDDVSGTYADVRDVRALRGDLAAALADRSGEPKLGLPGRQRGNGKSNDTYMFLGIGAMYYFGNIRCPQLQR